MGHNELPWGEEEEEEEGASDSLGQAGHRTRDLWVPTRRALRMQMQYCPTLSALLSVLASRTLSSTCQPAESTSF